MKKDIAERLKEFPTLAKLTMLGDVVSAQAIEVFSRDAMLEIEGLRADLKNIATQKTTEELKAEGDQEYDDADFEGGYDAIIHIARRAMQPTT